MLIILMRVLILYALIIFAMRVMGKRQIGELQPSELVITFLISEMATLAIEDVNIPMAIGVVPILVLVGFEIIVSNLALKNKKFRNLISGSPLIVIRNGQIDQKQLHKLRFSLDDLMESLRAKDVFDIRDVAYAIVETDGKLSVVKKHEQQEVTASMLQIPGEDLSPPLAIISDGHIIKSTMKIYHLTEEWLDTVLKQNGYTAKQIFLMTADVNANYYIVTKEQENEKAHRG